MRSLSHSRALWLIVGISTLIRLVAAATIPILDDEAHYWVWSRHLMWGYPDHPPMIAGVVAVGTRLLGDTVLAVRFIPVLLGSVSALAVYSLARALFGAQAGLRALLLSQVLPAFAAGGIIAAPDSPFTLFWLLAMFFMWKAVNGSRWAWPMAGMAIGLAIQSKLAGGALAISLAGFVIASRDHRRWLLSLWPMAAALAGALVLIPLVLWNAENGWATVGRALIYEPWTPPRTIPENVAALLGMQFVYYSPLGFVALAGALVAAARRARSDERFRYLVWCAVPTLVVVLYASSRALAKPHYTGPAAMAAVIAVSGLWETWRSREAAGRLLRATVATSAAMTALVLLLAAVPTPIGARLHEESRGWKEVARRIEETMPALGPPGEVFVLTEGYQAASRIAFATRYRYAVVAPFRGFEGWEPAEAWVGKNGIFVHAQEEAPKQVFLESFGSLGQAQAVPLWPGQQALIFPGTGFRGLR